VTGADSREKRRVMKECLDEMSIVGRDPELFPNFFLTLN
jgi:hypothetical protein